jgi:hypothetical protein
MYGPPTYGPPAGYGFPYGYPGAYYPDYAGIERGRQVTRTKIGVLVLGIAMIVGVVPIFGLVCLSIVLFLIGIILMAIGRRPFGNRHAKFVMAAVAFIVLYVVLIVVLTVWFFIAVYGAAQTGSLQGLPTTFWAYIVGVTAAGFLEAVAWVLFAHELENRLGKVLLYGALAALIVIQVAVLLALAPQINALLAALQNGTLTDPNDPRILELESFSTTLSLVGAIPTILFAGAYFLAYLRIGRGEVPAQPAPRPAFGWPPVPPPPFPAPSAPPAAPTAPPSPPSGPPQGPPTVPPP